MKILYKFFIVLICIYYNLYSKDIIESQPEIIFQYDKLQKIQDNLELQVSFNKAVLLLNKGEYQEAIKLFEKTASSFPIPSNLNIAISYYKLKLIPKAVIYFNKIYENKKNITSNSYSYMTACFYLYKISQNKEYLNTIVKISKKFKKLSEHSKVLLVDTYILLKAYKKALKILKNINYNTDFKQALLYIKLKDYQKAKTLLKREKNKTLSTKKINKILWFLTFIDLKTNNLKDLKNDLELIYKRRYDFRTNFELPLEIYFNKDKYSSKDYLKFVLKFDEKREIDFISYFAPFIFSNSKEIIYDSLKGFVGEYNSNLNSLEKIVDYNGSLLDIIKEDPIIRVKKMEELLKKNKNSYIYYNLALAYTHIFDYYSAFKYFNKAYKLNPGNKLYASMLLITANRINKKLKDEAYIISTIKSNIGLYNYFGKKLFQLFLDRKYIFKGNKKYKNSVFYKALDFIEKMRNNKLNINHPLLDEHFKDPLTFLIRLVQRRENESDFRYFSRLQDTTPLRINDNFLNGAFFITKYYMDTLKAIGLYEKADFNMNGNKTPSYLMTRAIKNLYLGNAQESIKILDYLQKEYKLEDKYTMNLLVAAYLQEGRYNDASVQISLIKALLNDSDINFLIAVELIQELKISSAKLFLKKPYNDTLIDFRLRGFDDYLESL